MLGVLALCGLALVVGGVVAIARSGGTAFSPYPAPAFRLPGLRSNDPEIDLGKYRGKPVVVNFFFSSCKPCAAELPRFEAEHQRRGDAVVFIGIDHFEPRADGQGMVSRAKLSYLVGYDETGVVAPQFGAIAFPATIFIDRNGVVRRRHLGALSASDLAHALDSLSGGI